MDTRQLLRALPTAMVAVATAVFVARTLPIGLHPDDVGILQFAAQHGYGDVWTSPFMNLFYRPVVVSFAKLGLQLGDALLVLRLVQAVLIVVLVALVMSLLPRDASRWGKGAAGLVLVASPMTLVVVTPFAVDIADTIVLAALLCCLRILVRHGLPPGARRPLPSVLALAALTAVAVLSKESGVLVGAVWAAAAARQRRWVEVAIAIAIVAGYLGIRSHFVAAQPFAFESGYLTEMLPPAELEARFGDSPGGFYAYNVVCNFLTAFIYVPVKGRFALTGLSALLALALATTTLITMRYVAVRHGGRHVLWLCALVGANAVLGYMYVRARIMFVSGGVLAVAVGMAIDDLLRRPQRVFGIPGRPVAAGVIALWCVVWVTAVVRLGLQARAAG